MGREEFTDVCRSYGVALAYLFGSYAEVGYRMLQGEKPKVYDPMGDTDLGLVFEKDKFPKDVPKVYSSLYCELEDFFRPLRLDLIFLQEAGSLFQYQAISGICVWAVSNDLRSDYEEHVIKYASDWKFELDLYYKEMLEELKEGNLYAKLRDDSSEA